MGTTNPYRNLLYALIVCLVFANGLSTDVCQKGCPKSDTDKLKYIPGQHYEYKFDSVISINVHHTEHEDTSMKVNGIANLYANGDCQYVLNLQQVHIETKHESLHKQFNDINKPIQFIMTNGEISTELCSDADDNEFAINLKRSIISMLQTTNNKYETDIFGICPTQQSNQLSGNLNYITTLRNLNECKYRENYVNGIVNSVYNDRSQIKTSSYMNGEYNKKQKLTNHIYETIELKENYEFVPYVSENTAKNPINVNAITNMKLTKTNKAGNVPTIKNPKTVSIIFKNPKPLYTKNLPILKKSLDKTIDLVKDYAKSDSANNFIELIRLMKYADAQTLIELGKQYPNGIGKKVYLDALFRAGTSESLKAIVKQISKMNNQEKRLAFMSFNLIDQVTKDALIEVSNLVNPKSPRESYLSIGNLINKYCSVEKCDNDKQIDSITQKFTDQLKSCKTTTKDDEDRVIGLLKGIRNSHQLTSKSANQLIECTKKDRSNRIRVAALQAFTAASCNKNLQEQSVKLLKDMNEDSEIRIESYLVAVACPNTYIANELSTIINNEEVHQVGGFIVSHLKSIRDSTDFTRESARHHFNNIRITKKFPIDPQRYSFNHELSYAIDTLGVGGSIDYNLIYSQNGFLPRSTKFNLTCMSFGQSFNIIEGYARQENLEEIFEYYLGPKGFFKQRTQDVVNQLNDTIVSRHKRAINADTKNFHTKYNTYGTNAFNKDINFDISVKLFGSEFTFLSLGNSIPANSNDLFSEFNQILMGMKNGMKNFKHTWEYHTLFYNNEITYPIGSGLPLEIIGQGAAINKFEMETNIDIDKIFDNPKNSEIQIKIIPSVDINLNGKVMINGGILNTGLQFSTNLNSASGSDIKLKIHNDGNAFSLDMELPRTNLKLIELKHNINFYVNENDKESKLIPFKNHKKSRKAQSNCFDQLQIFGLTICYTALLTEKSSTDLQNNELSLLTYPFVGPTELSLTLQSERKIHLSGLYEMVEGQQNWRLLFDTPNSQKPHNTKLELNVGVVPKLFTKFIFENPEKLFNIEVGLQNDEQQFAIYGELNIDNDKQTRKIGFKKNRNEFKPFIQIVDRDGVRDDINGYKLDGSILTKDIGDNIIEYKFNNFRIIKPNNEFIVINGWVNKGNGVKTELKIQADNENYKIESFCHIEIDGGLQENRITLYGYLTNEREPTKRCGGSVAMILANKRLKQEINIQTGVHNFNLHNELQCKITDDNDKKDYSDCKFINDMQIKANDMTMLHAKLNGEFNKNLINYDAELSRDNNKKHISMNLNYAFNQKHPNDYSLTMNGKLNGHYIDIKSKIDVKNNKYVIDNIVTSSWGTKLTLIGETNDKLQSQNLNINLHGNVQLTSDSKLYNYLIELNNNNDKMKILMKLLNDKIELIVLNGDIIQSNDKLLSFNMDLKVKDQLTAKGNYKLSAQNGRGDLNILISLLKKSHEIKVTSKFLWLHPKYDIDTQIIFNNNMKIIYKTENIFERNKFNTKNLLQLDQDKFQFNSNGQMKGSDFWYEHDSDIKFDIILPTQRKMNGLMKRKISTKQQNGNIDIQLNDILPDQNKRTFIAKGQLTNYNKKLQHFDIKYDISYKSLNNRQMNAIINVKHLPKTGTHFNYIEFDANVSDNELLQKPIELKFNVNEYCHEHAIYEILFKDNNIIDMHINGNYYVDKPKFLLNTIINLPKNHIKQYQFNIAGGNNQATDDITDCHLDVLYKYDANVIKFNQKYHRQQKNYEYNINAYTPWNGDMKISSKYLTTFNHEKHIGKCDYHLDYDLSKYGQLTTNFMIDIKENDQIEFVYDLKTNYEKLKNFNINFDFNVDKLKNKYLTMTKIQYNENFYNLDTKLNLNNANNEMGTEIVFNCNNKISKIKFFIEKLSVNEIKFDMNIENILNKNFNALIEYKFNDYNDLNAKILLKSNLSNFKQMLIELNAKEQSGGIKMLKIHVTNDNQIDIDGFIEYNVKTEQNKKIIEGNGSLKMNKKETNANFKLIKQTYNDNIDHENGYSINFNGKFGSNNLVSTLKLTNRNFHIKLAQCKENAECTNFEIQSLITDEDGQQSQHKLLVLINLLALGYPYEFELQSKTTKNNLKILHEIEMNMISKNNKKYQFLATIQPYNALIQFQLPKRAIVFEVVHKQPEQLFGNYENSIIFYFDKLKKPNDKTELNFNLNLMKNPNEKSVKTEVTMKFAHPQIRNLMIKGDAELNVQKKLARSGIIFDIFKTTDYKIIAESKAFDSSQQPNEYNWNAIGTIKSKGFNFEYISKANALFNLNKYEMQCKASAESIGRPDMNDLKFSTSVMLNRQQVVMDVNAFNTEIFKLNGKFDPKVPKIKFDSKLKLLELQPIEFVSELNRNGGKFEMKRDQLFNANGELKIGQQMTFSINGYNKKLYNLVVMLSPGNFLSTQYEADQENIRSFMHDAEIEYRNDAKKSVDSMNTKFNHIKDVLHEQVMSGKDSVVDSSKLQSNYEDHLNQIVKELEEDPALKEIIDIYRQTYEKFIRFMTEFIKTIIESFESTQKAMVELYEQLMKTFNEQILPMINEFMVKMNEIVTEFNIEIMKIIGQLFERLLKSLNEFKENINNLSKPFIELAKPITELLSNLWQTFATEWSLFWKDMEVYWQKLPSMKELYQKFNDKFSKLQNVNELLAILKDIFEQLEPYAISEDAAKFLKNLYNYIEAKLRNQDVNDIEAIKEICTNFWKSVQQIILMSFNNNLIGNNSADDLQQIPFLNPLIIFNYDLLFTKLPLLLQFKFSPINYLLNENLSEMLIFKMPYNLIELSKLNAHIYDGKHLFTYDGNYYGIENGNCKYILTQDYINNNFSVVANLKDGKLKSIIVVDKMNYIEINDKMIITLNGQIQELPLHDGDMHAWRRYYTFTIHNDYGVEVKCSTDLRVCHISVNNFYTSKLRGAFGNGNSEPYDDFMKPNSVATTNYNEFIGSYGLGNCKPANVLQNDMKNNEMCTNLFQANSLLNHLYDDPKNYLTACNNAIKLVQKPEQQQDSACTIALGYTSAARMNDIPIQLPEQCVQCKSTGQGAHTLDQEFKSVVPKQQADIIYVIDTTIDRDILNNLVQSSITDLREQLKQRGMTNQQFTLIGFNDKHKYVKLFTTNGKYQYDGNDLTKLNFDGPEKDLLPDFGIDKFDELLMKLNNLLSAIEPSDLKAMDLAVEYPFRSGAAKTIIFIRNKSTMESKMVTDLTTITTSSLLKLKGISMHYVGVMKSISNDDVATEKIVGFNKRAVATLDGKDSKKRAKLHYDDSKAIDIIQENNGWIFLLNNFEKLESPEQKTKFIHQMTSSIADQLYKTNIEYNCKCQLSYGLHAEEKCFAITTNFDFNKKLPK